MPLFGSKTTDNTANSPPPNTFTRTGKYDDGTQRRSMFGRKQDPVVHDSSTNHSGGGSGGGLFHRNNEDPSIVQARERVLGAERAEREADQALQRARVAVKEAKQHVKRIEVEAAEEARLAKVKQGQAKSISKRAKPLGRHDHI